MDLNQLFDTVEKTRQAARWQAAFGEPQQVGDKTIIPVAQIGYGYGLGFGSGTSEDEDEPVTGEGGGGGGGVSAKPLGAIVVTPEKVYFHETVDSTKIAVTAILVGGWIAYQIVKTLREVLGRA